MSNRLVPQQETLISGVQVAATNTQLSDAYNVEKVRGYCVQLVHTQDSGSVAITAKLQASNDSTNWDDIADSSQSLSGASSFTWNVTDAYYKYVRISCEVTSGTSTLTAILVAKS